MPNNKSRKMMRKSRSSSTRVSTKSKSLARVASHVSPTMSRNATGNVFPTLLRRTLCYSDAYSLASTTGSVALQQFKVNSLFDPDLTGTGHQPRGFDQLCSATGPYKKYRVIATRIALEIQPDNGAQCYFAAGFSDLSTLPAVATGGVASIIPNAELPGWRSVLSGSYGGNPTKLQFAATIADIESVNHPTILAEDNYSALYSADPADLAYFSMQAQSPSGGTVALDVVAHFEFDVIFEEPILMTAS